MRITKPSTLAATLLLALLTFPQAPADAQPQQIANPAALGMADLFRQLREVGTAMKQYGASHDHFPRSTQEIDECLQSLHKSVTMSDASSTETPKSEGQYRVFHNFAMGVDPSFKSVPIVNNVPQVPDSYVAPGCAIIIMTDGDDECVGWAASDNGRPLKMEQAGSPVYFSHKIKAKEPSTGGGTSSVSTDP
ncbi:MAG: hypothetical protein K2X27_18530 [Candidatus Obscuribacterales bacterium]|nr:hypothetical protein [Candidatus Obscuribacterales bacterium]